METRLCEAEILSYHPFTMGGSPHRRKRCENQAVASVTELSSGDIMYLCENCLEVFKKRNLEDEALYAYRMEGG